jgi:hypothetical protein
MNSKETRKEENASCKDVVSETSSRSHIFRREKQRRDFTVI